MYRLKLTVLFLRHIFFIIFDLFVIFHKAICISYAGRARLIDYEQSLFFISPSSETCEAREWRLIMVIALSGVQFDLKSYA